MGNSHRVTTTDRLLERSLVVFMKKKKIEKISVKELCAHAGVNRSTFYLHYADIYDLLYEVEERFYSYVSDNLLKCSEGERPEGTYSKTSLRIYLKNYQLLYDNRDVVSALFGEYGDPAFQERMLNIVRSRTISRWKRLNPNLSEGDLDYIYHFLSNGGFSIVRRWVTNGMKESVEYVSKLMYTLTRKVDRYMIDNWDKP